MPIVNGHLLNIEDRVIQNDICELMYLNKKVLQEKLHDIDPFTRLLSRLSSPEVDGLVEVDDNIITVTRKADYL